MKEKEENKELLNNNEELFGILDETACSPEFAEGCILKEEED